MLLVSWDLSYLDLNLNFHQFSGIIYSEGSIVNDIIFRKYNQFTVRFIREILTVRKLVAPICVYLYFNLYVKF